MDWSDDSEENPGSDWDVDEEESVPARVGAVSGPSTEASEAGPSHVDWTSHFVVMGFSEELVAEAIKQNRKGDTEGILETLLTNGGFTGDVSEKDKTISLLVQMGFLAEEASLAIDRCGPDASISELADSICAAHMAEEFDDEDDEQSDYEDDELWESSTSSSSEDENYEYNSPKEKKRSSEVVRPNKRVRTCEGRKEYMKRWKKINDHDNVTPLSIPKPMVGFGLPFEQARVIHRKLPDAAIGPPFFYYENVAIAPKGVWETISRFLYDIEPEFVDSKYFCATARKRGYLHNLPIDNRFPLLPIPPKTIHEAFPSTRKWWPLWDTRTHLNCLMTSPSSARTNERIRSVLAQSGYPPPQRVQDYVLEQCRKWNLIWIGLHKVAPLDPEEIEMLLGFPRNHTRGMTWRERYTSLANSFQVDTVAFHLSVLKHRFPNGMTILSLFSGIGGAELALHRLGICLKTLVLVELSANNRNVLRRWWEETDQKGTLIEISDVQQLNGDRLEHLINTFGGFDLVIGGSPCNNLAGRNRYTRDGLEGEHSILFYDYFRILDLVKCIMEKNLGNRDCKRQFFYPSCTQKKTKNL